MATPMTRPFPSFEPVSPPLAGGREVALFAGCPELLGTPFSYSRKEEIYGEGEDADVVYRLGAATMLRACAGLPKTSKPRMGHARFMSRSAMSDMDLRRRGIAAGGRMAQAYFSWSRRAPFGQNSR